jgi:hypothetical protein
VLSQKKEELSEYITKCENEIMKREERELGLLTNIDAMGKEIGIYVDELTRLRETVGAAREEGEGGNRSNIKTAKLPPFPKQAQKCRNCELLTTEKEGLYTELQKGK